jgi:hypothetical protein
LRISHEYGDGVAGMIVSQMMDSERRTCEPGSIGGGVGSVDVDEKLFCVPVEEGA